MDRCDFCSIMTCLKNHISESNQMSQPEFLYEIFADFMDSQEIGDFSLDNGLVCRWMTGQAKISPKISSYYAKPSKQVKINPAGKIALIRNEDKAEQIITSKTGRMTWEENCFKGSWISQ